MSLEATVKPLSSLSTKYGCIVADPPWMESGGGKIKRGADRHYPLMRTEEIAALPVQSIALPDAHLYMWITNNFLARGAHVEVARGWGFRPVTVLTWKKEGRIGLGQYFRGTTEHVVFCVRGKAPYKIKADGKRAQGVTDFEGDTLQHACREWDFMEIDKNSPEFEACLCFHGAWWEEPRPGAHSKKPPKIQEWAELVSPGPYLEMFARSARPGWDAWGNEAPEGSITEDPING